MMRTPILVSMVLVLAALAAASAPAATLTAHGVIDVTASGRGDGFAANTLTRGDNPFDPYGVRMFVESQVNPQFAVFGQVVLHDAVAPYVDGAYVMWTPRTDRDFHVMAGKVPWLIGTFAPRTYSDKNPLIGKPLLYQHHTSLVWFMAPPSADALLASAGTGQAGVAYLGGAVRGMPAVDDSWWDTGIMANGSLQPLEFSLGLTTGTPGWGNGGEDENRGKTTLGRIGLAPTPWLRVGASGAYGPYLVQGTSTPMPPNRRPEDYHQQIVMGDLEVLQGHAELRAEALANTWETPNLGNLKVRGGYLEGKFTLTAGLWAAARWDALRFSDIVGSAGVPQTWDQDQDRIETGLGLRWDRNVIVKSVFQRNFMHGPTTESRADLYALQLTVVF